MRRASFFLTQDAIKERIKTRTRRKGFANLKPGDLLQPIVKGQGLKRGEKQELLGPPIRVTAVQEERWDDSKLVDYALEGFTSPLEFARALSKAGVKDGDTLRVIDFEYTQTYQQWETDKQILTHLNF